MHLVVIHGWQEVSSELVESLSAALGIIPFEARQKLLGGGPAVLASFADKGRAEDLAAQLEKGGIAALLVDPQEVRSGEAPFEVRSFELTGQALKVETADGRSAEIDYDRIELLISATGIVLQTEETEVTTRKFSVGKTLLAGGLPMSKKVKKQQEVTTEVRDRLLCLYAGKRPPFILRQGALEYDGLKDAMQLSRERNFAHLSAELRRLCPAASFDERLLQRAAQVRLLGPALAPESHLDLAFEILSRCLRSTSGGK